MLGVVAGLVLWSLLAVTYPFFADGAARITLTGGDRGNPIEPESTVYAYTSMPTQFHSFMPREELAQAQMGRFLSHTYNVPLYTVHLVRGSNRDCRQSLRPVVVDRLDRPDRGVHLGQGDSQPGLIRGRAHRASIAAATDRPPPAGRRRINLPVRRRG